MTKDQVLSILKEKNEFVSGEEISNLLHISRAAVNIAIKSLRNMGYIISSATNKGYKLINNPDLINKGELINCLGERANNIIFLDSIDSTNNYLKKIALNCPINGQVVISNIQTNGRGRMGRSFIGSNGYGIYLSYLLKPNMTISNVISITAWVSVALIKAIERVYHVSPDIKWVNDILLKGKKIAGILTEASIEGEYIQYMIIGIGINVNEENFPDEIKDIASSLFLETGKKINRSLLVEQIIMELDLISEKWPNDALYYDRYVEKSIILNKEVRIIKGNIEKEAKVISINKDFSLLLDDKTIINSGEVSIRKK